jgi:hypothetical protein
LKNAHFHIKACNLNVNVSLSKGMCFMKTRIVSTFQCFFNIWNNPLYRNFNVRIFWYNVSFLLSHETFSFSAIGLFRLFHFFSLFLCSFFWFCSPSIFALHIRTKAHTVSNLSIGYLIKGTVPPDWICPKLFLLNSLWFGHATIYLNLLCNYPLNFHALWRS